MINSPQQILNNSPEAFQSSLVPIQPNSPTNSSNSATPPSIPPRVSSPMAHTNPPAGPRRFESRAMPSPFNFSLIQGAPHDMPEK